MDEAKPNEILQWLTKAKHDLGSAQLLFAGEPNFLDTAVYHCQQCVEKALKAYLTLKDTPFEKIHDLSVLIEECINVDRNFEQLRDLAEILTPYAIAFRYPGEILEPELLDAEEALNLAKKAFDFVLECIPREIKKKLSRDKE
jgi:HEPN domain-containing protein